MMNADADDWAVHRARSVADSIKPLLAGHGGDIQGAVLVELVALHIAGHPPQMREGMLSLHVDSVRHMVPVVESELFGPRGHPAGREP